MSCTAKDEKPSTLVVPRVLPEGVELYAPPPPNREARKLAELPAAALMNEVDLIDFEAKERVEDTEAILRAVQSIL